MKTTNRIRITKPVVATRADAETMLGEIAEASALRAGLVAELEGRIVEIRQEYEGKIDALDRDVELKTSLLKQWAEASPEEFTDNRKSIDLLHGRLGFRTGTPKLKTLAGWTWERVMEALKKDCLGAQFVRVKEAVDKEGLLSAHAAGALVDAQLRGIGVRVVQEEGFFVDPKTEETAP
ncbi:MAG: host-nuclease inhibitor Gam family protein [Opitutaceae bacterium]|jgi:phage host-nuclease inhibitor protein Gam|nr:host-nuclease inhibitor Gam family protein [Opitutaceae bacterium]